RQIFNSINRYMLIKFITSLGTGICIWIWLRIFGIEYAVALAVAAVLFNFIPIVGNILMAVPAVLIALVQANFSTALLVTLGYVIVNGIIGNVVEPRLMGRELGISSVVVLLSLLFWGSVFGPIGRGGAQCEPSHPTHRHHAWLGRCPLGGIGLQIGTGGDRSRRRSIRR